MGHIKKVVEYISQEDFIPLVKELPAIWNIHCEDYSIRSKRKQAWESIYVQFFEDFHERSPEEQTEIAICFQTKWKSLRNSYAREVRKQKMGTSSDGKKRYVYFEQLSFLESAQKCTYYVKDGGGSVNNDTDNSETTTDYSQSLQNTAKKARLENHDKSSDIITEKVTEDFDDIGEESSDSLTNHDESNSHDADGDKLFMLSLVPEFKRIPQSKRLLAKSEILNVILKAQGFV